MQPPSKETISHKMVGLSNLDLNNRIVDVVLTHSLPMHIQNHIFKDMGYGKNKLLEYFDEIERQLDFGLWFSGHYHLDKIYDKRHVFIYDSIVKLTDTGFEQICPK